jgi:hypothetical protein
MRLARPRLEIILALELALLVMLVVPGLGGWRRELRARHLAGRLETIESAAITRYLRENAWPEGALPGKCPSSLASLLPSDFSFIDEGAKLAWDYWELGDRSPLGSTFTSVSVTEQDPRVLRRVVEIFGAHRMHLTVANRATFVVETPAVALSGRTPGS